MEIKQALDALTALAHETRLNIFRLLVEHGTHGLPAGAIGARLDLANATLSFHLKELSRAELVHAEPQGRSILYSANFQTMNGLIAFLTENCCRESGEACGPEGTPVRRPAARAGRTKRPRR
jgi:DNA-binding transcriptional ArsR family regulator